MSLDSMDDAYMAVVVETPKKARMNLEEDTNHIPIAMAHFAMKAQKAKEAEECIRRARTFAEMEVDSETLMDKMDAEAHANITLAGP